MIEKLKWKLYKEKERLTFLYGLKTGRILPYSEELIERLRTIYYGGVPASILLLSTVLSNGHCYDRALLMSRAFLDTDEDVKLIYASVDSIKYNPAFKNSGDNYADHCIVEVTQNNHSIIIDTSLGLIFDKKLYWKLENPKVRLINDKETIKSYLAGEELSTEEDMHSNTIIPALIVPLVEKHYNAPYELYSHKGIELLQKEVELYKQLVDYESIKEKSLNLQK